MARVNLDSKVWTDPRVKRLARRCAFSMRETVGTLCAVWDFAYSSKSAVLAIADVNTAAETDGFADHMVAEQLAEHVSGRVRICGVAERIDYLLRQGELGRIGGEKRVANAKRDSKGRLVASKGAPGVRLDSSKGSPALPPDPSPDPSPDHDHDQHTHTGAWVPGVSGLVKEAESRARARGVDLSVHLERYRLKASEHTDTGWCAWLAIANPTRHGSGETGRAEAEPHETFTTGVADLKDLCR